MQYFRRICIVFSYFITVFTLETPIFTVSSITYSPGLAESVSRVSIVFASSLEIGGVPGGSSLLLVTFPPNFSAIGESPTAEVCASQYGRFGSDMVLKCVSGFSSEYDVLLTMELFESSDSATSLSPVLGFVGDPSSALKGSAVIEITSSVRANAPIKVVLCCMQLPAEMGENSDQIGISLVERSGGGIMNIAIPRTSVKFSPQISAMRRWNQLRLEFDPPTPYSSSVLTFTLQPGDGVTVPAGSQLCLSLPGLVFNGSSDGLVEFTVVLYTNGQMNGINLFNYYAEWNAETSVLTFFFAADMSPDLVVIISTLLEGGGFTLPGSSEQNNPDFAATVFVPGGAVLIEKTSFFQSEQILPPISVLFSQFTNISSTACCSLTLALNRDVPDGTLVALSLPGYAAVDKLIGDGGIFDSSKSILTFTLPSDSLAFPGLIWPLGQYENDPSITISIDSRPRVPVMRSPALGVAKRFVFSSLWYDPQVPLAPSNISISFEPSVPLFSQTVVKICMRGGFQELGEKSSFLYGESCHKFETPSFWNATSSCLHLKISEGHIIDVGEVIRIWTPSFSLPSMLSENDQILTIQSSDGVVIHPEPIQTSPPVGTVAKSITNSEIVFDPLAPKSVSTIRISFTSNTDILVGGKIIVHLGGFSSAQSPSSTANLTGGVNAPSFTNQQAEWIGDAQDLILTSCVLLKSGIPISVSVSNFFTLPNALLPNDQSLWITVPNMGIVARQFFVSSDRINNQVEKSFAKSQLSIRDDVISLTIIPTFDLLPGSILHVSLPGGFVFLGEQSSPTNALSFPVAQGGKIEANSVFNITISNQFILPTQMSQNDPSLTLSVGGSQFLPPEPIKESPAIVPRIFTASTLSYDPNEPMRTSLIEINLTATVRIEIGSIISVTLTNFVRLVSAEPVLIESETPGTAIWNASAYILSISVETSIPPQTPITFKIPESQLFQLPSDFSLNSPLLTVAVLPLIPTAPFLSSPLVGDGPYSQQLYCMHQYESSPRVHINNEALYSNLNHQQCESPPICSAHNWVKDPCSLRELKRCGCSSPEKTSYSPYFPVSGFNLQVSDTLFFVPQDSACLFVNRALSMQVAPGPALTLQGKKNTIFFESVRALAVGNFTACLVHHNDREASNIGTLIVRGPCEVPLVSYGGACLANCPANFFPEFGECKQLSIMTKLPPSASPFFEIEVEYPNGNELVGVKPSGDPTVEFFTYTITKNLVQVLGPELFDSSLFEVVQITKPPGDIVSVTVVVTSKRGFPAIFLMEKYFSDFNSILYSNSFFSSVTSFSAHPHDQQVQLCADISLLPLCPMQGETSASYSLPSWYSLAVSLGGFVGGLVLGVLVLSCYRLDSVPLVVPEAKAKEVEGETNNFSVIKMSARHRNPVEYAEAWLKDEEHPAFPLLKQRRVF